QGRSSCLAGFAPNLLAGVANALALVWLRRTEPAQLRCDLADERLVRAIDDDRRRLRRGELDPSRRAVFDRMREPERELQPVRPHLGLVADSGDLELLA